MPDYQDQLDRIEGKVEILHKAILGDLGEGGQGKSIYSRLTRLETTNRIGKWVIGMALVILGIFR